MKRLIHTIRNILSCEQGVALPFVALMLFILVVGTGVAIDYGRAQMVQSKLHSALDAAGLAAAATAATIDPEVEARKYIEANFPQGYMQTQYEIDEITPSRNPQNGMVSLYLKASGEVETTFMRVAGFDALDVSAETTISQTPRQRGFEMVMVLDNSGSMGEKDDGETRLRALKRSAKKLVDNIYKSQSNPKNVYVGLVPFNHTVRVGDAKAPGKVWNRQSKNSDVPLAGPVKCVHADTSPKYPVPSRNMYWEDASRGLQIPVAGKSPPSALFYTAPGDNEDKDCNVSEMMAMQNNPEVIKRAIDRMESHDYTRIDMGAIWGWRMISPEWRGFWNHSDPALLPRPYNQDDSDKIVVILSDGKNEVPDAVPQLLTEANNRLRETCKQMKSRQIIIYTVTLHLDDADTQALMRNCATSNEYYFHVPAGKSLDDVFSRITDSLVNLRISK